MKGLLLKDFYIIKDGLIIMILTIIGVGVGLSFLISPWILIVLTATVLSMTVVTTIQNDKATKWNNFTVTLPVSRQQVISSKYFMYIILSVFGVILGAIIGCVATVFKQDFQTESLIMYSCLAIIVSLLPGSISIPCSFLLDEEKSIVGMLLSYIFTAGIFAGIIFILSKIINLKENILFVFTFLTIFSFIFYFLSWIVSKAILCNKDIK